MQSPCTGEASNCFHGCCMNPFLGLPDTQSSTIRSTTTSQYEFAISTTTYLYPNTQFTNHESLPSVTELFSNFTQAYPQYLQTNQADQIRAREYYHLSISNHVCFDYIGHGLFSYVQQQSHYSAAPIASTSTSPPPNLHSNASNVPFFKISNKSVNLYSQILYGGKESEFDSIIQKRIMSFMNISEDDYSMVFTANQSSAFKLLTDCYPFKSNRTLLTVYDYENEAVETMIDCSKKRGAHVMSAEFSWPNMSIQSKKLRKMVVSKRKNKKRGLFVFPLQSKITGARYSYLWMSLAQEYGWHVLLDASALGAKDMDTLGLSLFKPDFIFCSFYKVLGGNPSGFGCLFVKKSSASLLNNFTTTSIGIVSLSPESRPSQFLEKSSSFDIETEQQSSPSVLMNDNLVVPSSSTSLVSVQQNEETFELQNIEEAGEKQKHESVSEIAELENPLKIGQFGNREASGSESSRIEFRGLDHADSLGLILISSRTRYLVNWLVNAMMSLQHPHSEYGLPLVRIYGPKVRFDRGPAVAFNVFDWKGEKVDPVLVQKLADRNNISLSFGILKNIWFSDKNDEERNLMETRTPEHRNTLRNKRAKYDLGISVITASLGLLTNFEDTYRLWAFASKFLDADFVEKERREKEMEEEEHEVYGGEIPDVGEMEGDLDPHNSADVDMSTATDDDAVKELDEMKKRLKEMEEEAAALREMQAKVEKEMGAVQADPANAAATQASREEVDSRSIFVGNVDYACTPEEVQQHFQSCGTVNRVTILTDKFGQPKGFAYVEFVEVEAVQEALSLTESELHGRQLKVMAKRTNVPGMKQYRPGRFNPYMGYRGRRPYVPPYFYSPYGYGKVPRFRRPMRYMPYN